MFADFFLSCHLKEKRDVSAVVSEIFWALCRAEASPSKEVANEGGFAVVKRFLQTKDSHGPPQKFNHNMHLSSLLFIILLAPA